jgi:post-segregation antitoxin (ccd killing protein)
LQNPFHKESHSICIEKFSVLSTKVYLDCELTNDLNTNVIEISGPATCQQIEKVSDRKKQQQIQIR